jgi:hypothetical protein
MSASPRDLRVVTWLRRDGVSDVGWRQFVDKLEDDGKPVFIHFTDDSWFVCLRSSSVIDSHQL